MRDFINAILSVIGASYLTDEEYDALDIIVYGYDVATYNAILAVLDARELVSNTRDRLTYYFKARGVEVEASSPAKSDIFLGAVLE
jgi:hypothetical protein